jgi:hypothetical protein
MHLLFLQIEGKEALAKFLLQENDLLPSKNLLKNKIYLSFLLFLVGFRPDHFISPVKCAMLIREREKIQADAKNNNS